MKIMRGDAYPIFIELTQNDHILTPDMVSDVEICVGEVLSKKASSGGVLYDESLQKWYIRPTQEETLSMEADSYQVIARVKYANDPADVKGILCGYIMVDDTNSTEVI